MLNVEDANEMLTMLIHVQPMSFPENSRTGFIKLLNQLT